MRARYVRFRRSAANADDRHRFLIAVTIPQGDRSVEPQLNLEAHRILTTRNSGHDFADGNSLPSENDAILILDPVDIVARPFVSAKIVPQAGDHALAVHSSFRTELILTKRQTEIQRAVGGYPDRGVINPVKFKRERQIHI